MEYGFISLIPIIVVLVLIFVSKNAFVSIIVGLLTGSVIILIGEGETLMALNSVVGVFASASNVMVIFFVMLVGGLLGLMRHSGGLNGLVLYLSRKKEKANSKVMAQLFVMLIGILMFVDATSSVATTALVGRPLFYQNKLSKDRLGLICNSTSSPIAWIIPFGGAAALVAGALNNVDGITNGFELTLRAVPFQFYTIILMVIIFLSVVLKFEFGKRKTEEEITSQYQDISEEKLQGKARNMIVPLIVLVVSIFVLLLVTGGGNIMSGDGSTSVFLGGIIAIAFAIIFYSFQKICKVSQSIQWCFDGMKDMLEVTVLLIVAFGFSSMIGYLGTANYLVLITANLPTALLPVLALILSAVIAFCTGTSAGTVLLMIPLIIPMGLGDEAMIVLLTGAIISGSVFGDQNSVISDTVIMTSSMIGIDPIDHFKTQIPYTGLAVLVSAVLYLVVGFII